MTVCDKAGGAVFEITSKAVVRRECVNGVCCCTNHFRTDELATDTRCWRFDKLLPLMTQTGKLGVADVFEKLDAVHQGKFTLQSMVFEPAGRKLHLKYGASPATKLEAKTFDLGKMFDAK
jgi:hypothetical protein